MTKGITNRQMVFIIFLTLTTYTSIDLPKFMAQTAARSSWIPILIVTIVFALAVTVITRLNNMFQGKVFFDYSKETIGKAFTYIVAAYYSLYFLLIGVYLKLKFIGLLKSNFLPLTPQVVTLVFGIVLFAYAAYKGILTIARIFEIAGILFLIVTVTICIFMLSQGMHYNILPFFNASDTKKFLEAGKELIVPFGGIEVLLIIPFTKINKKSSKVAFFTLLGIGLFYVLIVESTFMILGVNNTLALNDSFIEGIKIVDMPVIERTDIFYLTFGLTSLFAGMMIIFAAITEFTCKLFPKIKRGIIVIIIALMLFVLGMIGLGIENFNEVFGSFATYLVIISGLLIPVIVYITAKLKQKKLGRIKN